MRHVGPGVERLDVAAENRSRLRAKRIRGLVQPQLHGLGRDGPKVIDRRPPLVGLGDEVGRDVRDAADRQPEDDQIEAVSSRGAPVKHLRVDLRGVPQVPGLEELRRDTRGVGPLEDP
jgi:hypothetical protein